MSAGRINADYIPDELLGFLFQKKNASSQIKLTHLQKNLTVGERHPLRELNTKSYPGITSSVDKQINSLYVSMQTSLCGPSATNFILQHFLFCVRANQAVNTWSKYPLSFLHAMKLTGDTEIKAILVVSHKLCYSHGWHLLIPFVFVCHIHILE